VVAGDVPVLTCPANIPGRNRLAVDAMLRKSYTGRWGGNSLVGYCPSLTRGQVPTSLGLSGRSERLCGASRHQQRPYSTPPCGNLLAWHVPLSPGTGRLEQGRRKLSWLAGVALAGALGVDCRALLEGPEARPEKGRRQVPNATAEQTATKKPRGRPRQGK
jgi:hypothetical protein